MRLTDSDPGRESGGGVASAASEGRAGAPPAKRDRPFAWYVAVRVTRWTAWLLILGSLFAILQSLPFDQAIGAANRWIAGLGWWGPVVLGLAYVIATILFVPGTILTLAAGALFGLGLGMVTVSLGSTAGAACAFLIARYGARDRVAAIADRNPKFGAIDRAIGEGGWKIVALLRLSPAIPFNLQNYLYGLTPVRFWPYVITSWLAMLPGTFLYVYLGHVTGAAIGDRRERTAGEWWMLVVGLLATAAVTVYVTRLARQKLKEQVDAEGPTGPDAFAEVVPEQGGTGAAGASPSPSRQIGLVLAAVAALVTAGYARQNSAALETWVRQWLPPSEEIDDAGDAFEATIQSPAGATITLGRA